MVWAVKETEIRKSDLTEESLVSEKKENLSIVRELLERFNSDGVNYCHWKSNQHFCDALTGIDDLDILIDRSQYGHVMNILQELRFKHFYIPSARTYVGIEDFLGFDFEQGVLIHLHLHSQLVVGEKHLKGFHLPVEAEVLSHRRFEEQYSVYMSSYYDELLLLVLRAGMKVRRRDVLKANLITGSTKAEYEWLKEKCPEFLTNLENTDWLTDRIRLSVTKIYNGKATWLELNKLKKYLYKDLAPYSQGSGIHNTVVRNYREAGRVILEIKKRYLHTKYSLTRRRPATGGVTIAFLGSDGAGKSSAIAEIQKWLYAFMDVRFFYLGSGDGNSSILRLPLKAGLKIAQKFGIVKKSNNFSDEKLETVKNEKLGKARQLWVYTLSSERIKKLRDANRCKLRGFIVLTDRYPQSEFPGLCDGPRLNNSTGIAAKKEAECFRIAKLCPPDLAIKLIVPPEVAVQRKPGEITIETSRNLTERVKEIRFSDHTKCVEVDSAQEQKKVWLDIKRAIWDAIG